MLQPACPGRGYGIRFRFLHTAIPESRAGHIQSGSVDNAHDLSLRLDDLRNAPRL